MDSIKFYERMRQLREDNDLNQEQVAQMLKVVQKTYSDYELGNTRIPVERMIILAKYYNVSMDYLCGISNVKNEYPKE